MGPGYEDLGAFRRLTYFDDVAFDALAYGVGFGRNLFRRRQDRFGFPEIDIDALIFDTLDDSCNDVIHAVGKFIIDDIAFGFTQALNHDLFGGLSGDAAEVGRCDIDVDDVADFIAGIDEPCLIKRNFDVFIFDVIDDGLGSLDLIVPSRTVQGNFCRRIGIGLFFVGRNQDGFQRIADDIRRYAFLFG